MPIYYIEAVGECLEPTEEHIGLYRATTNSVAESLGAALPFAEFIPFGSVWRDTQIHSPLLPLPDFDLLLVLTPTQMKEHYDNIRRDSSSPQHVGHVDFLEMIARRIAPLGLDDVRISDPAVCFSRNGIQFELTPVTSISGEDIEDDLGAAFTVVWPQSSRDLANPELKADYQGGGYFSKGGEDSDTVGNPAIGLVQPHVLTRMALWCEQAYSCNCIRLVRLLKWWNISSQAGLTSFEVELNVFQFLGENAETLSDARSTLDLLFAFLADPSNYDERVFQAAPQFRVLRESVSRAGAVFRQGDPMHALSLLAEVIPVPVEKAVFWESLLPDPSKYRQFCQALLTATREDGRRGTAFDL